MNSSYKSELKLSFPVAERSTNFDPAAIQRAFQYTFLMQTLSPLIDYDRNGSLVGSLAAKFEWKGDELFLTMRGKRTAPQIPIVTAEEAALSLKRLIIIAANSHGNLKDMLCRGSIPKLLSDPCDGISVRGDHLVLSPGKINTSLVPMLTSQDFAILPRESYDPETLQITSYAHTSGPYRVAKDDGQGRIELEANTDHFHWKEDMPQRVQLVPSGTIKRTDADVSISNFRSGKVDMLSTIDSAKSFEIAEAFGRHPEDASVHMTEAISVFYVLFSRRGVEELDLPTRFAIGRTLREALQNEPSSRELITPVWTYFPTFGELTKDSGRVEKLKNMGSDKFADLPLKSKLDVSIGFSKLHERLWKSFGEKISSNISVKQDGSHIFKSFSSVSEMPHLSFSTIDTGAFEDINLVSYTIASGMFGHTPAQAREWLSKYQALDDKSERLKILNDAHFQALENGTLIPLAAVPYAALIRKPWKMNFSRFSSTSPLWQVTWN